MSEGKTYFNPTVHILYLISGTLHNTRTNPGGFLPGWYKLEIMSPCGKIENITQYYEGLPHQDSTKECPLLNFGYQLLKVTANQRIGKIWKQKFLIHSIFILIN